MRQTRHKRTGNRGFSLVELMVSMSILAVVLAFTTDAFVTGIRQSLPRLAAVQLYQDSRDLTTFMRDSVERAGAGDVFDRNGRQSTFAAGIIPRKVTGSSFGVAGPTTVSGDGGSSGSDEITLAGTYPITGVVAQDNGAGLMTLTYVPYSRHISKSSTISYRQFAYQFFNRLYKPSEASYYYPGLTTNDVGQLMIVRSHGTTEMVGRYRMVRIKNVAPAAAASMPTAYDVQYAIEPLLPFNRWIQELAATNASVKYYDSSDPLFGQYAGGISTGCDFQGTPPAGAVASIITAGTPDMNNMVPPTIRPQKCSIAVKAYLHTYFINRPTGGGVPQLARYDYTGKAFPNPDIADPASDFSVVADGVEDMQVEYYFQSDATGNSIVPGPGVAGQTGFSVPISVDSRTSEPDLASLNCIRFMFMVGEAGSTTTAAGVYPPLSNRTGSIPTYTGMDMVRRIPVAVTYPLKSQKGSQLFGSLGINN